MDQSSIFKKTSAPPGLMYVNANDLKRPEIGPPIYHSTAKLPVSNEKQNKFKFPTPNTTKERPKVKSLIFFKITGRATILNVFFFVFQGFFSWFVA